MIAKKNIDVVFHGDCLKFGYVYESIKLVNKFMPWVRKVWILYNDLDASDVEYVKKYLDQYNFIPISSFVPVKFHNSIKNSCVVESWIFNCEKISNYFVYFCDDMFVGKPLDANHFFVNDKPVCRIVEGHPNHSLNPSEIPYVRMWQNAIINHKINYTRISHNALPYRKDLLKYYYKKYKSVVDKASLENTERAGEKDFNLLRISTALMIMDGNGYMLCDTDGFFCESSEARKISQILKMKPSFFCVNNITKRVRSLDRVIKELL